MCSMPRMAAEMARQSKEMHRRRPPLRGEASCPRRRRMYPETLLSGGGYCRSSLREELVPSEVGRRLRIRQGW